MSRRQSLQAAVRAAKSGALRGVYRCGLSGCPEGGWAETAQAIRRIADELPRKRSYTVGALIARLYRVDHAGRYRVRDDEESDA